MDEAITLIEAAMASRRQATQVTELGDTTKPEHTGHPNVPLPSGKATKVIRASEHSTKTYLETEADVDSYLSKLKAELISAVRAGQLVRIQ